MALRPISRTRTTTASRKGDAPQMTVIQAMDTLQNAAQKSKLASDFWQACEEEIKYLGIKLGVTANQAVLLAIMCESGEPMTWKNIADFLGISRLKAMNLTPDIDELKNRRWISSCLVDDGDGRREAFRLAYGIIKAFRHDEVFVPESISGLNQQQFVDHLLALNEPNLNIEVMQSETNRLMLQLLDENPQLAVSRKAATLSSDNSRLLLLNMVMDYGRWGNTPAQGMNLNALQREICDRLSFNSISRALREGTHELMLDGTIEWDCEDGIADKETYKLSSSAAEELLGEVTPQMGERKGKSNDRDLLRAAEIVEKSLFYNEKERNQINRLKSVFSDEGLQNIQSRLKESGLRTGITCLFYGAPGTGKTETVLQLARETGRNIMSVDISSIRDKFVGESEKNIKAVFSRYANLCKGSVRTPILLFNEADAIINNRFETTRSSVEKMDNAIQNIVLQELEKFEGILVATTNLTGTLDRAFDRRFLFKVEFTRPTAEAKRSIWRSMIPSLTADAGLALAEEFDFSGGQIENISRKCQIEYVLSGDSPSLETIRAFCKEESINRGNARKRVGF